MRRLTTALFATLIASAALIGQEPSPATFDVVSIRKSNPDARGASARTTPDGTTTLINQPIRSILMRGASEPVDDIENLPDWAMDRYDVIVKPPQGVSRGRIPEMWRNMLSDRLEMRAHVEHREVDGFGLVIASTDGRLGPNVKPSSLDCRPRLDAAPPPEPRTFPTRQEAASRCGMLGRQGVIVTGGMDMRSIARVLRGAVDGKPVVDRTGLAGFYAFELTYSTTRPLAGQAAASDPAAPPDMLTAVREQLGLKLEPQKIRTAVLVIDHIEPPSGN